MRFAYIDSQGNEISIPSVDALELRIELGAIGPDTELYDAQSDRWGPAHTHDIYNTLAREAESEGFVAPPPPIPSAPEPSEKAPEPKPDTTDSTPSTGGKEPFFDLAAEIMDTGEGGWGASDGGSPAPVGGSGTQELDTDLDLDFTLVDAPGSKPSRAEQEAGAEEGAGGPDLDSEGEEDELGEVSLSDLSPEPDAWEPALPLDPTAVESDLASDLEIDVPFDAMDFSSLARPADLEVEGPLSAFEPEPPPAWLEHEGAWSDDPEDVMDFSRARHVEESEAASMTPRADQRDRERKVPRSRPSPPRRTRPGGVTRILSTVVLTVGVVGAGWVLWQRFGGEAGGPEGITETPGFPPVSLPRIPAELLPRFRTLGDAALSGTLDVLAGLEVEFGLPEEPRGDWLAGAYLANASGYEDIQRYWEGLGAYVARLREVDASVFHEQFRARLEAEAVPADTAAILLERADSGFLSTRARREAAYRLMDDLVGAALALHGFLLENESDITYEPAAGGVSRDPVLEAVPATRELGSRMWDMVDRITGALDALGSLDRVTTQRLVAVLIDRVGQAGFD